MKITRAGLRKLILEAVDTRMYDNEVTDVVNPVLTKLGLRDEYRAMAATSDENAPTAVLVPGIAEGPAPPVKFNTSTAGNLIEKIEKNQLSSAVFGVHDVKTGAITFKKLPRP